MESISVILFIIATVLAAIAAFAPNVTKFHLGWLAVAFLALAHVL